LAACKVSSANFNMSEFHEQCVNIKFCVKLGKTFTKTHEMLKEAYGDQCMGRTQCYEWFKRFKDGRQSTDNLSLSISFGYVIET
jgi:hypothetical protein